MTELDDLLATAHALADAAADIAARTWRAGPDVAYKADGSSLTQADLAIEARWREMLRARFPGHGILGEEYGADAGSSAFTWVLDPIDGTRQFGAGLLNHASLIGLCREQQPILGIIDLPLVGARYAAAEGRGTRFDGRPVRTSGRLDLAEAIVGLANPESFGATSLAGFRRLQASGRLRTYDGGSPAYGALARGRIDVCLNGDDLDAYDICALCPVVSEAGGAITDWAGRALTLASRGAIVASATPELHHAVLARLSGEG